VEIFGGLNIVSISGFFGVFMLKKSGVATVSRTHHLRSFIVSMASSVFTPLSYISIVQCHFYPC